MTRKVVRPNHSQQFDLISGFAIAQKLPRRRVGAGGRTFQSEDRCQLYFGMVRLDEYLKASGLSTPLIVASVLDKQDFSEFESRYAASGRAPYSPRSMMGLILYGVMQGVSSLRLLEQLARSDLGCLWITGGIAPDHASLGRFITLHDESLSGGFFESLTQEALRATGSNNRYLAGDGTVIEAACSHYGLLKEEAIRSQRLVADQALQAAPDDLGCQAQAQRAHQAERVYDDRKSARQRKGADTGSLVVSGTEPAAMVQPQKRKRGKAASYKASILANPARVIVAQDVDPSSELSVLPGMLDQSVRAGEGAVGELSLDGGYFSTEVIDLTLSREISLLCPGGKAGESTRGVRGGVFAKSEFRYDRIEDVYVCPAGEHLQPMGKGSEYERSYKIANSAICEGCELRSQCSQSASGRRLRRLHSDEAKEALREVMEHPQAKRLFRQRQAMVEPVFSVLRGRQGLNRFRRRGLLGVKREFALHVLAYNLKRTVMALKKGGRGLYREIYDTMRLMVIGISARYQVTCVGKGLKSVA